jgi:LPXTG-motif cell wall-anchored protein
VTTTPAPAPTATVSATSTSTTKSSTKSKDPPGTLPRTGLDLSSTAGFAAMLLVAGLTLRRRSRPSRSPRRPS